MFTGIIQKVVPIEEFSTAGGEAYLSVCTNYSGIEEGESIAINGVCLTVSQCTEDGWARFYLSPETMLRTNLGKLKNNSLINMERALRMGDSVSGHFVQGHVDLVAKVEDIISEGSSYLLRICLPFSALPYCVPKGSIAVDGVSLTVNQIDSSGKVSIQLIPHTWQYTRFRELSSGDFVNIELDFLAKYVEKQCKNYKELFSN